MLSSNKKPVHIQERVKGVRSVIPLENIGKALYIYKKVFDNTSIRDDTENEWVFLV